MIKYVYEDMGLDDLALLDLRELDPPAALGRDLIMLFATARSERHLHVASGRFVRWLRRNHKIDAKADGLIGPGELKMKLRRLRKRAKLSGTNALMVRGGDNGLSTGWVCVNFSSGESGLGTTASYDADGRYSGFGAPQTGTTIVVQCMTELRRSELDLETLWRGKLRESFEQGRRIKGEPAADRAALDELVASKVQLTPGSSTSQWQALRQASQQQRYFSTLARRLQAQAAAHATVNGTERHVAGAPKPCTDATENEFAHLRREVNALHARASPLSQETFESLVTSALRVGSRATASERLALVDELLLTGQERGLVIDSGEMMINLIVSMIMSPAYDNHMARVQKNLELVLAEKRFTPRESQVLQLMSAYARRGQWEQFWETFRWPARILMPRSADVYALAFHLLADTKDAKLCREAVSRVYVDMRREEPPVQPEGAVYESLKACVLVAEPRAEEWVHNEPVRGGLTVRRRRKIERNEFVQVLQDAQTGIGYGKAAQEEEPPSASLKQPEQQQPDHPGQQSSEDDLHDFRSALARGQLPDAKRRTDAEQQSSRLSRQPPGQSVKQPPKQPPKQQDGMDALDSAMKQARRDI